MRTQLLRIGVPNLNGVIYPRDVVEKAVKEWNTNILVTDQQSGEPIIDLVHVCGEVESFEMDDEFLYCNIKVLNTPAGEKIRDELSSCTFSPMGLGKVVDGVVLDYQLYGVSIVAPTR